MLTIVKGDKEIIVTNGAFKSIYEGLGYKVKGAGAENAPASDFNDDEPVDEQNELEELLETPLEEMGKDDLKRVAKLTGVTMKGKTKEEVIEAIRENI